MRTTLTTHSLESLESHFKEKGFQTELRRGNWDDPIPAAFSRTQTTTFGEEAVRVIGLEDFIAMNVFAGRPQDLIDARRAIAVSSESLNRPLLEKLTARFGKESLELLKSIL